MWFGCNKSIPLGSMSRYAVVNSFISVHIDPLLCAHGNVLIQPFAETPFYHMGLLNTKNPTTSNHGSGIVKLVQIFDCYCDIFGTIVENL